MSLLQAAPTLSSASGGAPTITVYIGKIPASFPRDLLDALLSLFQPQLLKWRRAEDPATKMPKAFGFADFTDSGAADTFRRVFEAIEVPGDEDSEGRVKNTKLVVKVDAAAEQLIAEGTERSMKGIEARMRDEERRRIASLPPGMEDAIDEAALVEKAKNEYLKGRDGSVARIMAEVRRIMGEKLAAAMEGKLEVDEEAEKERERQKRKEDRERRLREMDEKEAQDAIGHNQREKERTEAAFAGHERRYAERERERFRRIAVYRSTIFGYPACKRSHPMSKRDREDEAEKDRLDREEEQRELEELAAKKAKPDEEEQQQQQQQNDSKTLDDAAKKQE